MDQSLLDGVEALTASVDNMETCLRNTKTTTESSTKLATNMLPCNRVFQLVSEYDMQRARLDLMEEIEPLLQKLYSKLEKGLGKLERERATLSQTFELNKLRLNNHGAAPLTDGIVNDRSDPVVIVSSTHEELERLKELKNRKEELLDKIRQLNNN